MEQKAPELWTWIDNGAHVYVCGDATRMASDVDRAIRRIVRTQGRIAAEDADQYVREMRQGGQYQRDVS